MNQSQKEDALYTEIVDVQLEMASQLKILIQADWDSDTVKSKLISIMLDYDKIDDEIFKLEERNKSD